MKINELTKFAITLALLPWIPFYLLYRHGLINIAFSVVAIFLGLSLICFLSKNFAKKFKRILDTIGHFIGKYLAIFILSIGYIVAVIPTGLLMKIVKRDRLKLKKPDVKSYWIDYDKEKTDYEFQF